MIVIIIIMKFLNMIRVILLRFGCCLFYVKFSMLLINLYISLRLITLQSIIGMKARLE